MTDFRKNQTEKTAAIQHWLPFCLISIGLFFCNPLLAQTNLAANTPSKKTSGRPVAEGVTVWGVFEGRVPCQKMAGVLRVDVPGNCEKLKWGFTFFQDPKTHQPTRYILNGSLYREKQREGNWAMLKGTPENPNAVVIQLDPDNPEKSVFLLKGDDNVLFILDRNKNLMVGGDYLSYTFNRVVN